MNSSEQEFVTELRKVFLIETGKHLQTMASGLVAIQEKKTHPEELALIDSMHRAAHSMKGSALCVNLKDIGAVCQSMENIFLAMIKEAVVPTTEDLAVLKHAVEKLSRIVAAPLREQEPDVSDLIAQLESLKAPGKRPPIPPGTAERPPTSISSARDTILPNSSPGQPNAPGVGSALPMAKPLKALVIEDSECDALLLLRQLRKGGYDVCSQRVQDAQSLITAIAQEHWDIIFSDHNMPNFNSTEALNIIRASHANVPFIIVSGSIGEEVAVAAMKAGAQDYLMKGHLARLVVAVERELQDAKDRQARHEAERALLAQKEDLRIAREIQEHLFPSAPPIVKGFDIAGATCPAEATGGDYYDFILSPRGETLIVIGDVSGHGLGPALLMADVRAYLRALAPDHANIPDLLTRANHLLRDDLGNDRFITMLFAGLIPATRHLQFINAGHPPGYVLDQNGGVKTILAPCVAALGINPDIVFPETVEVTLAPSDLVVFLTDGAIEATGPTGEEFGVARILDLIRRERHQPATDIITGAEVDGEKRVILEEFRIPVLGKPWAEMELITCIENAIYGKHYLER